MTIHYADVGTSGEPVEWNEGVEKTVFVPEGESIKLLDEDAIDEGELWCVNGWSTDPNAGYVAEFQLGEVITPESDMTLYLVDPRE